MVAIDWLSIIFGYAIVLFLTLLGGIILLKILRNEIDLSRLLSETDGEVTKASFSRFQFMVFTFVIAGVYLLICIQSREFVDVPEHVLWLLGISGGSYVGSKIVQKAGG